jgi:plasmid maintenance system antidote protein VapI
MQTLAEILTKNDITCYQLAKKLGLSGRSHAGIIKKQILGQRSISDEDLLKILKAVGEIAGITENKASIKMEALRWKLII